MTATKIQVLPETSQERLGSFDTIQRAWHSAAADELVIGGRP